MQQCFLWWLFPSISEQNYIHIGPQTVFPHVTMQASLFCVGDSLGFAYYFTSVLINIFRKGKSTTNDPCQRKLYLIPVYRVWHLKKIFFSLLVLCDYIRKEKRISKYRNISSWLLLMWEVNSIKVLNIELQGVISDFLFVLQYWNKIGVK